MPMVIIFLGVICSLFLFEIEGFLQVGARPTARTIAKFSRVRKSWAMLLLVLVTGVLAAFEIYLYLRGGLYADGISVAGFFRLFLLVFGAALLTYLKYRSAATSRSPSRVLVVAVMASLALVFLATYIGGN